jgi:hypothetical protein
MFFSGVDVVALLQTLHMPDSIVEKVKNVPETAGFVVVAIILYKVGCLGVAKMICRFSDSNPAPICNHFSCYSPIIPSSTKIRMVKDC